MKVKNKKGFTLIEIIICLGVISVIATVSFIGVKYVFENIRLNKLNDIEDEILTATRIYLETNNEVSDQVYSSKNGAMIPLNVLINEGYLDISNTDLKRNDIEDEYVYTSLSNSSQTSNDCIDLKMITSWNESSSAPIYVCTDSKGIVI